MEEKTNNHEVISIKMHERKQERKRHKYRKRKHRHDCALKARNQPSPKKRKIQRGKKMETIEKVKFKKEINNERNIITEEPQIEMVMKRVTKRKIVFETSKPIIEKKVTAKIYPPIKIKKIQKIKERDEEEDDEEEEEEEEDNDDEKEEEKEEDDDDDMISIVEEEEDDDDDMISIEEEIPTVTTKETFQRCLTVFFQTEFSPRLIGLEKIEEEFEKSINNSHQFIIIHGSKASGKTHFVKSKLENLPHLYFDGSEQIISRFCVNLYRKLYAVVNKKETGRYSVEDIEKEIKPYFLENQFIVVLENIELFQERKKHFFELLKRLFDLKIIVIFTFRNKFEELKQFSNFHPTIKPILLKIEKYSRKSFEEVFIDRLKLVKCEDLFSTNAIRYISKLAIIRNLNFVEYFNMIYECILNNEKPLLEQSYLSEIEIMKFCKKFSTVKGNINDLDNRKKLILITIQRMKSWNIDDFSSENIFSHFKRVCKETVIPLDDLNSLLTFNDHLREMELMGYLTVKTTNYKGNFFSLEVDNIYVDLETRSVKGDLTNFLQSISKLKD